MRSTKRGVVQTFDPDPRCGGHPGSLRADRDRAAGGSLRSRRGGTGRRSLQCHRYAVDQERAGLQREQAAFAEPILEHHHAALETGDGAAEARLHVFDDQIAIRVDGRIFAALRAAAGQHITVRVHGSGYRVSTPVEVGCRTSPGAPPALVTAAFA